MQERLEIVHAAFARPFRAELIGMERAVDDQLAPGSRDGHIEPPFAAIAIQGAEVGGKLSGRVEPERDRKQHHIALVPLDVLKILDHGRLDPIIGEVPLEFGMVAQGRVEQVLNHLLLLAIEGHDAKG